MPKESCDIKCPLKFLVLWIISKCSANGAQITKELEKRRGSKPSPGTIYPALKELKKCNLIESKDTKYNLTKKGKQELEKEAKMLTSVYYDFQDIKKMVAKDKS